MKKILLSALAAMPLLAFSQVIILTENFDTYNDGDYAGVASPWMSTWSGTTGGAEDCLVTSSESSSPANSIVITGPQAGGTTDAMLVFPSDYTTGHYVLTWQFKVAAGQGGYFNLQSHGSAPGTAWLTEVFFASDGTGSATMGGQQNAFTYTNGDWVGIICDLNLDTDQGHIYIDGAEVGTGFQISLEADGAGTGANLAFGGANFYSYAPQAPAVGDCEYYVDDIALVEMPGSVGITPVVLEPAINVYPNPSTGNFSVNFEDMSMDNANVVLVDVLGKVIYNERMSVVGAGVIPFNMNLRNGVYFVTISDGNQKMTKKVIVRK